MSTQDNPELWCIFVHGPGTVIAQPDKATAEKRAAEQNGHLKKLLARNTSPNDPHIECVVEPWPYSAEAHAKELAEHGGNPDDWC